MARPFSILTLIKFSIWPSWTWGDGATVRDHPEMRAGTDWLSADFLDVTLARDDQSRCLSCGEGLSLVFFGIERGWEAEGHYQFLAIVHAGVKPHFGFPHLKIHWTSPRQGWCPAQQPWEWSRRWRGLFWWIQQVCHQDLKFTYQDSKINFSQCFILFFQYFIFIWSHPKWFSFPFTFNCNSSINIVDFNFVISLKMSDEG